MSLCHFLRQLFDDGRVVVEAELSLAKDDRQEAAALLAQFEGDYRQQFPGEPPAYDPDAALQGALTVFRAAQLLVYREMPAAAIDELLPQHEPSPRVERHYSVDLCLRFLPDLIRLARAAATEDPLVVRLREIGACWPLSSVGLGSQIELPDTTVLAGDAALWREYVDRVIRLADESRLKDPRVAEAVAAVVGNYPALAGKLMASAAPAAARGD